MSCKILNKLHYFLSVNQVNKRSLHSQFIDSIIKLRHGSENHSMLHFKCVFKNLFVRESALDWLKLLRLCRI